MVAGGGGEDRVVPLHIIPALLALRYGEILSLFNLPMDQEHCFP